MICGMHFVSFLFIIIDHNQNNVEKDIIKQTTKISIEIHGLEIICIIEHD
jgi:hypothetical protein